MPTISLGKVALTWRGAYNAITAYASQDVISFGGSTYIAKTNTTGADPTDLTKWDLLAQGIESVSSNVGELVYFDGTQLQPLPVGTAGQILKVGNSGLPEWGAPEQRSGMRAVAIQDYRMPYMYRRGMAVMSDGTLRMWGRGTGYMLGQGVYNPARSYPIRVGFPPEAGKVIYACGQYDYAAVAITDDGKFWAWGENDHGEVGRGDTTNTTVPYCSSDNVSNSLFGKTAIDYAPMPSNNNSLSHLVLCSDGTVHSCGINSYGQLGQGDTTQRTNFVQVPLLTGITKIARGRELYTNCFALKDDGTVYSWGYAPNGGLGHGNATQMNIPMQIMYFVQNNITIVDIGTGTDMGWAIDDQANLYTWGLNNYGQLGHSGTTNILTPTLAATNVKFCYSSGIDYQRTNIIKTDGSVWATGGNYYGCLGVAADTTNRSGFQECLKEGTTGFTNATKVVLGGAGSYNYTIVLDEDGVCWSVGYSGNGQLGRGVVGTTHYWYYPVLIHRRKVVDIACVGTSSEGGTLFLLDDGQVAQCGYAGESQLPEDDDENIAVPMPVLF